MSDYEYKDTYGTEHTLRVTPARDGSMEFDVLHYGNPMTPGVNLNRTQLQDLANNILKLLNR